MPADKDALSETSDRMIEVFSDWQKAGLGMMPWASPAFLQGLGEFNTEVAQFVTARIKEDMKTQQEILSCKDPVELQEIQGRFLKTAFDQYCAETGKLARMNQAVLDRLLGRMPDS